MNSSDKFVNLKRLKLSGHIKDGFNFELLESLSNQLEELVISIPNVEYEKLFDSGNFSALKSLHMRYCNIGRVEKKFIERFPNLEKLRMSYCQIETIEYKAFSNLKALVIFVFNFFY